MIDNLLERHHIADGNRTYAPAQVALLGIPPAVRKNTYAPNSSAAAAAPDTEEVRPLDPRAVARGRIIRKAREDRHMSQTSVGEAIGVSRVMVSHWEAGRTKEDIPRQKRLDLCKTLGLEERELLLDPETVPSEFDMPLSSDAKSIAYRWDSLPETERLRIKKIMAEGERLMRESPDLAKRVYPELESPSPKEKKP